MKHYLITLFCLLTALPYVEARKFNAKRELQYCHKQVLRSLSQLCQTDGTLDFTRTPRNIGPNESQWNQCSVLTPEEWTAGFWPGILWMTGSDLSTSPITNSQDDSIRNAAIGYTNALEYLAYRPVYDHDLGFIMIGAYLKGYEALAKDSNLREHYRTIMLAAADTLATLFNPQVGTLLSWPRNVDMFGGHNTIMDNMLNLELLFWAAEHTTDRTNSARLRAIAISHADTTMQYHFRPDFTINHVAVYDPVSGCHLRNCNHQGLNDQSVWSRGESWAIYGYTMVYRYTHDAKYLSFVEKVTDKMISELPADGIPYWDMRDPKIPNTYRDASAGAVIADALLELSTYVLGAKGKSYRHQAIKMLQSLSCAPYRSGDTNPAFLLHSVGNYPASSEIDYSINYADYYYVEGLRRAENLPHFQQTIK